MDRFFDWLVGRQHSDSGIQDLVNLANKSPDEWQKVTALAAGIKLIDDDANQSSQEKTHHRNALQRAWTVFQKGPGHRPKLIQLVAENAAVIVIGVLAIAIISFLIRAIFDDNFLKTLADVEVARGLITFFFALGTVGVSIILVAAVFTSADNNLNARFDMGKQVLTTLIGVFGTIIGFYFGAEFADQSSEQGAPTPTEQSQQASNMEVTPNTQAVNETAPPPGGTVAPESAIDPTSIQQGTPEAVGVPEPASSQ